jgi:hypothetical protein
MSEERRKILDMLAQGKIDVDEAERLLQAVGEKHKPEAKTAPTAAVPGEPKYLKVKVEPKDGRSKDRVNITVPLLLIKAGIKLGSVLPNSARNKIAARLGEKGIDIDLKNLDPEALQDIFRALKEMRIEVDEEDEKVEVYCE